MENTVSITGGGDGFYYWTNEAAPAGKHTPGSILSLHKTTFTSDGERNSEVIARGTYQQIKEELGERDKNGKPILPQGMKFTQNHYFYNPESKQIEVFRMAGAANGAFISFTSKNRGWGRKKVKMSLISKLGS